MTSKKQRNKKILFRPVPIIYKSLIVGYAFEGSADPLKVGSTFSNRFFLSLLAAAAVSLLLMPQNSVYALHVIDILPSLSYPLDWLSLLKVPNFLI